ncbi:MAG TPA: (5-formylfuran-3-yl)methyl phosphate synthase, partial [Gemmatirosa sp.]
VRIVREIGPDVVGVRGAACDGGRTGRISAERVRALRAGVAITPAVNDVSAASPLDRVYAQR